ncbi:MAG: shikimate kinase, partial [Clostridia bacterium]|nr:shikimate kinase [Clostridia bacterium]
RLAKALDRPFIDTDAVVVEHTGEPLENTLEEKGMEAFLDAERDAVLKISPHNSIISTGGSVILREETMKHLKGLGVIVYLRLPFCTLNQRVKNFATRGVAHKENETLKDVYDKRIPIYESYEDIRINCNKKSVSRITDLSIEELERYKGE